MTTIRRTNDISCNALEDLESKKTIQSSAIIKLYQPGALYTAETEEINNSSSFKGVKHNSVSKLPAICFVTSYQKVTVKIKDANNAVEDVTAKAY